MGSTSRSTGLRPRARAIVAGWAAGAALAAASLAGCHDFTYQSRVPTDVVLAPPVRSTATRDAAFPLSVSADRRHLVDRRGRPFLLAGDAPQSMVVNMSLGQAERYVANRRAAGMNALWVNLLCRTNTGGRPDGRTYDGIRPFRRGMDLSTPNEAYFRRADALIRIAARHGVAVILDPIETIDWLTVLRANGTAKAHAYGRYLGKRFRHFSNIVWMSGNDFQTWRSASDDALALAVARGIKATNPRALQTVELDYLKLQSGSLDDPKWRGLISLDAAYTYRPTYARVLREYRRPHPMPVFMVEANYEGEHDYRGPSTLRRQEYWTMLSGATGQLYGSRYTWPLPQGWEQHLDTVGTRQFTYMVDLFTPRRWYDLVPDDRHKVVVSGFGTPAAGGTVQDSDYVTAAATRDGRLAMAYVPTGNTIGVDLARLARGVTARWYDPTDGRFRPAAGMRFGSEGIRQFSPPGRNSEGDPDWVLVLASR